jgi:hypothetical protein
MFFHNYCVVLANNFVFFSGLFNVVEFLDSKNRGKPMLCVVPDKWMVNDTRCVWPPYQKQKLIDLAVERCQTPAENWTVYDIRLLGCAGMCYAQFHDYDFIDFFLLVLLYHSL